VTARNLIVLQKMGADWKVSTSRIGVNRWRVDEPFAKRFGTRPRSRS
jgi:hypothetical protein